MNHKSANTVWYMPTINRMDRELLHRHKSAVIWFTGLSGSGKSTLAHAIEAYLYELDISTYVLDGDNVRHGLCGDLGFSDADRVENIRRVGEVAKLLIDAGVLTLTAFISPFKSDRAEVRKHFAQHDFIEVYCQCSVEVCEARDVKGLYKKARSGEIKDFTGISSPYEAPEQAELVINTQALSLDDSVQAVLNLLRDRNLIA